MVRGKFWNARAWPPKPMIVLAIPEIIVPPIPDQAVPVISEAIVPH